MSREEQVWEALHEGHLAQGYVFSEEESRKMKKMFMGGYLVGQIFTQIRENSDSMDELISRMDQKQQELVNVINKTCLTCREEEIK